jgi:hypothetical protein
MNASTLPSSPAVSKPARPPRPRVRLRSPRQLEPHKEAIWALNAALVDWSRAEFEASFSETPLYAVFEVRGEVVGISAVLEQELEVGGRRVFTIGLGRAVVAPAYRNQFLVQRALIFRWFRRFVRRPWQPIYIWGSCVSYKSYLSFVRVLRVVYPVADTPTPAREAEVIDQIGRHWYGALYDPVHKVVHVPGLRVRDESVQVREADLADPAIRFYHTHVPSPEGATYGLLTISPCIRANFLPMIGSWIKNLVKKRRR